jgi:hypothetical protein
VTFQSPTIAADQSPVPAIASLGSGFLVAWNGRGPDGNDHLFAQVLGGAGPFALVPDLSDRATPPSAASAGGAVVITDEETRVGSPDPDVFAYAVIGSGAALAEARYGATSDARAPEAVALSSGGGIVWTDYRSGDAALWYAPFGSGEKVLVANGVDGSVRPSLAPASDAFLAVWVSDDGELRVRPFKSDGRPAGDPRTAGPAVRGDVAWNGTAAGLVWRDAADRIWFRAMSCGPGS